jgi:multisubunit Na+/H+ antiporter MnhB subunit
MSKRAVKNEGMSIITRSVTSIMAGFIALFGAYIAFYGHLTPGGGFAGGVIVAAAFILITLTHSKVVSLKKFPDLAASLLDNLGALSFVVLSLLGFLGGTYFLNFVKKGDPFTLLSSGTVLLANISIMIKVMAGLFAIFVGLSIFGRIVSEREKGE